MRIGIYLENYDAGGVEAVIANTITSWPRANDKFVIVANREADGVRLLIESYLRGNIAVVPSNIIALPTLHMAYPQFSILIKVLGFYGRYLLILANIFILKVVFKKHALDALFIHNGGHPGAFSTVSALVAAKTCKIPHVVTVIHSSPRKRSLLHYPFEIVYDRLVEHLSRVACVSQAASELMGKIRHFSCRPLTIHNGVQDLSGAFQKAYQNQDEFHVAIVGRLSEEKGHEVLLNALTQAKTLLKSRRIVLHIFGKGPSKYKERLCEVISDLGLCRDVRFHGFVKNVPQALSMCHCLVLPTLDVEGLPMVILEAMSLGIPVIATDVGGVSEVVEHNVSGLIIQPNDIYALATALAEIANNHDLSQFLASNGRKRYLSHFTAAKMAQKYHELICGKQETSVAKTYDT